MQETEIDNKLNHEELRIANYNFELETNSVKSRTGIFIANEVPYRRRSNLEGKDSHKVIIDIEGKKRMKQNKA